MPRGTVEVVSDSKSDCSTVDLISESKSDLITCPTTTPISISSSGSDTSSSTAPINMECVKRKIDFSNEAIATENESQRRQKRQHQCPKIATSSSSNTNRRITRRRSSSPPPSPSCRRQRRRRKSQRTSSGFNVTTFRRGVVRKSFAAIKRSPHGRYKKTLSTVIDTLPDTESAKALFEGIDPIRESGGILEWEIGGAKLISRWINGDSLLASTPPFSSHEPVYVHPVAYDDKVWRLGGSQPSLDSWASFEMLRAAYDKSSQKLTLCFRTYLVGHCDPMNKKRGPCMLYSSLL